MKTKIRKIPNSVISVILALSLLVSSSVATMFISNAVTTKQDEEVGASVVEEGEVGATFDKDDAVGATQYIHWGTGNQLSDMTNPVDLSSGTATITVSGRTYFIINGSSTSPPTTSWLYSGTTVVNNLTSIDSGASAKCNKIQGSTDYYIIEFWCSNSPTKVKVDFQGTPQKVTLSPAASPVCSSVSIETSKTTVASSSEEFTLTATADIASALSGKSLTYTFYDSDDNRIDSVTSSTGTATLTLTQSVREKMYKVKVSYSGYESKTSSNSDKVTNTSVVEPAFKYKNKATGTEISLDQGDPAYGVNVYYAEITVTHTSNNHADNTFRIKRNSDSHLFTATYSQGGNNNRYTLEIEDDPFILTDNNTATDNYLQINPTQKGTYRIYVDQTDTSAPKVWVEGERDIFITTSHDFYDYVDDGVVPIANVANFSSSANTQFKGYKSGNIWSANAVTDYVPFMLSTKKGVDYELEYLIRDDLCTGVSLVLEHVMVGDEDDGEYAQIFKIKSNVVDSTKYTKNIILHIDTDTKEIYATATFDQTQVANTAASDSKKITYYFAKSKNDDDKNKLFGGDDGIKIYYWNNSVSPVNTNSNPGYKYLKTNSSAPYGGQVTATPVNRYGQSIDSSGTANTIYVDLSNPIAYTVGGRTDTNRKVAYEAGKGWGTGDAGTDAPFWIYKAEIPSWATSFAWCNDSGYPMWQYESGAWSQPAVVLNPNRVYCFYGWGDGDARKWYTIGARLDETLWDKNGSQYADEAAKFIKYEKTNVIKYNMTSDDRLNPTMNAKLVDEYTNRGIVNELYFGNFYDETSSAPTFADSKKPNIWKVWNNLAQRKYDDPYKFIGYSSYFASIWDLSGGVLNLNRTSTTGGYYLNDTYQKADLPMFDYDTLSAADNGIATAVYQNVDFPFYKNTYNGITSYSYDSLSDYNRRFNETTKTYTYSGHIDTLNDMQAYKPISTQKKSFANEFIINFYMTESGKLKPTNGDDQDITFNFSGDDDVWVYIDGVKVLDLGGAHMISAGSINLSEMKTYYRSTAMSNFNSDLNAHNEDFATDADYLYTVDIQKLFDVYGIPFNNKDASTQHTLQMFYVERGENESNCSISFNLPQNSGLRIENEINTNDVNPGLKDATLAAANQDYFSYYIENSVASDDQMNAAKTHFGLTNIPTRATAARESSFYLRTPDFPANNPATINRGTSQLLLNANEAGGKVSAVTALSNGYFSTGNLNYKLTDAYATGEITTPLSGRTTTSSNGALFNLLYGESATFNTKITPHTWLVVKQENTLYTPTDDGHTITRSTNSVDVGVPVADQRNASRFYATTYTIKDDAANKEVGRVVSENNMEEDVLAHSSDNSTGYYFSNYSNTTDVNETVAATYKFVNSPHTGTIKITKQIDAGDDVPNAKASFKFTIQFKDIFGVTTSDYTNYNIKYRVYDSDDSYVERYYNNTNNSIMLRHNQTAEIVGIPAGTKYKIIEEPRGGYNLDHVNKKSYRSGVLKKEKTMYTPEEYEAPADIDYLSKFDSGSYLADFLYVNEKVALKVVVHYYDRKMENGVPVNIDSTPTNADVAYNVAPEGCEGYEDVEGIQVLRWIDTQKYITNAVEGKLDNVVDQYSYWTSNSLASAGIQTKKKISYTKDEGTGTYTKTETPYASVAGYNAAYHPDCYGDTLSDPQNSDKWVTYYDSKNVDITDQFTDEVISAGANHRDTYYKLYNRLARIDVWAYNEPKQYTATVHGAAKLADLVSGAVEGVKVGNGIKGSVTDYYNTRFGVTAGSAEGAAAIDSASDYMKHYGRETSFTNQYPCEMTTVERVIGDYKFAGWATKADGTNIITNDYYCGYRILDDMDLYPVYMINPTKDFGLTITPNDKDTYIASNGTEYTRLNVTYNPYNTTGDRDTNITEIAMVNIRMADTFTVNMIDLDTVRTKVKEALDTLQTNDDTRGAHTITVTVTDKSDGTDITKTVHGKYNANELNYDVTFDTPADNTVVKLNNKNRVMLTQTYNSSLLAEGKSCNKLLVLGAMKYRNSTTDTGDWTISNNYLYYEGGVCH